MKLLIIVLIASIAICQNSDTINNGRNIIAQNSIIIEDGIQQQSFDKQRLDSYNNNGDKNSIEGINGRESSIISNQNNRTDSNLYNNNFNRFIEDSIESSINNNGRDQK